MSNPEHAAPVYQGVGGEPADLALRRRRRITEPVIQYARTSDGVNIAYYSIGEGSPPLVYVVPFSHLVQERQHPELHAWCEGLAANRRIVRLDRRGTGLSDRDREFTLDSAVHDIEAVARKEGLKRFALMGQGYTSAIAILYASQHPETVSHLVLWSPVAGAREYVEASPPLQAAYAAATKDWRTFTELFALQATGWEDADKARRFAAYLREVGYTSEEHLRTIAQNYDVSECLGQLTMPVLVMHRRESAFPVTEVVRKLATDTPTARFVLFEGSAILPIFGDSLLVLKTIDAFLAEPHEARPAGLTEREAEILTLLAGGASNEHISRTLSISTRTVERHIGNIYVKIGAHNRAEATAYAFRHALVPSA
jgi:pimeloyl-ACP methyl ester carboxylesterase/DNA-binding CsgD family transcriptional regulator